MGNGIYDIQLMKEVQDEIVDELVAMFVGLIGESIGPDGETYGDTAMSPGDRIAQFLMDAQSGQMDMLQFINPEHADRRARQYVDDIKHSPFIAHTYETPRHDSNEMNGY